jgi:hypothetical protein
MTFENQDKETTLIWVASELQSLLVGNKMLKISLFLNFLAVSKDSQALKNQSSSAVSRI